VAALRSSRRRLRLAWWLLLALVALAVPASAQQVARPALSVGSGRLFTSEGWEVRFSKFALLEGDSTCFLTSGAGGPQMMPVSAVLRVQRLAGHHGVGFAAVGAIIGAAEGLLVGWAIRPLPTESAGRATCWADAGTASATRASSSHHASRRRRREERSAATFDLPTRGRGERRESPQPGSIAPDA
jgi:hypothetical protein